MIRIVEVMKKEFCENVCFMEPNCVSINLEKRVDGNGNYKCELNNATHEGHEDELKKDENYFYHAAEVVATSFKIYHFIRANTFMVITSNWCKILNYCTFVLISGIINFVIIKIIIIVIVIIITNIFITIIIIITFSSHHNFHHYHYYHCYRVTN